ncbi:23S rRNA (adenine(2503)-C(2))-methyltransferase RlmN [Peptococcaceae bacterium 1198_IL3148]
MMAKLNLRDLNLQEMEALIVDLGEQKFRAKQICQWILQHGVTDFDQMTNIGKGLRQKLQDVAYLGGLEVLARQTASSGDTVKYLFGYPDGEAVESVLMRHSYGRSACVSTQVGCRMGCRFCASTIAGVVRNLSSGEIYDQVLAIQRDSQERVSHVVLMGSGEPLDNYEQTIKFIRNIAEPYGLNISYRHLTLSTCGIVPGIKKLAQEKMAITLAVSLHAPNDQLRNQIMPINRRYPLSQLIPACKEYVEITGRRITFEYSLMKGVNDGVTHADELGQLLKGMLCHVNLIPINPVKERGFERTASPQIMQFQKNLERHGVTATVRKEMGADIDAACGQLRRRVSTNPQHK